MERHVELSRGLLTVSVTKQHQHWELDSLLDFAERINPKRAFLFVSKVLGKHIPVKPSQMVESYKSLASMIPVNLPTPMTVVGMAETAVCLGAGVYRELKKEYGSNAVFMTTTRHPAKHLPVLSEFLEEHSHAQDQLIYGSNNEAIQSHIKSTKTLVLVDDEISTGKTFKNLIQSLIKSDLQNVERIILVSLVNWNDGNLENTYLGVPIETVALLHGNWSWDSNNTRFTQNMPDVATTEQGSYEIIAPVTWGREPSYLDHHPMPAFKPIQEGEKVLVLGSGEFLWLPFLVAEKLELDGHDVYFSSTTRSPIMQGKAIKSICSFQDNYGLGIVNYAYNVKDKDFDRVLLIVETPKDSIDPALFSEIKNLEVVSYE
ncbi:phosphoribosyltransferase [Acinetobacter radioresistens]|uniref:phosphoribosyltransferase domain-containing protein n=1 Tax=Acinetobacter radioresistens TaxID=40216 RepID=UPI0020053421|nr:phosphoribosyltransferase domain-containing protein [Acinetobacter radioresistens]MCK4083625.1 phosphoribosyltransferase [Acinetobacter radioresistens]